jgi:hypothetical protein
MSWFEKLLEFKSLLKPMLLEFEVFYREIEAMSWFEKVVGIQIIAKTSLDFELFQRKVATMSWFPVLAGFRSKLKPVSMLLELDVFNCETEAMIWFE